ncbi:MAG: phosphopantothenoylcysteine decarboxylase [Candidatus Omnitrophica bacterium]|nr:phosphopantothenoylcysteine decarboxylase [Candidatus Omnitrophota bacterium]
MVKSLKILITAGPTREYLDPVRFISNSSTGVMGYTIARTAVKRGHKVRLISGPTAIDPPLGIRLTNVISAREMARQTIESLSWCNCLIMSAAVCDYRPKRVLTGKMNTASLNKNVELVKNIDILKQVSKKKKHNRIIAGFALQTDNLLKKAKAKLIAKDLDLIIANELSKKKDPFGQGLTSIMSIDRQGNIYKMNKMKKEKISVFLLDKIEQLCYNS